MAWRIGMKNTKTAISIIWFIFVSLFSPFWIGCIYMNITGHGKGYSYDMGSEADIAVFFGVLLLLLWLLAILPVTISLCKKGYYKKKPLVCLPFLSFAGLFVIGICILGWKEFIMLFGYGLADVNSPQGQNPCGLIVYLFHHAALHG